MDDIEIIKQIQSGNKELLDIFVKSKMDLIYKFTKPYYGIIKDYEDLVQEMTYALISNIYSYKSYNVDFSIHISRLLYISVKRYILRNIDNIINEEYKILICIKEIERYYKNVNLELTPNNFSKFLCISSHLAKKVIEYANGITDIYNISLDTIKESVISDSDFEEIVISKIDKQLLKQLIMDSKLSSRYKNIIIYYYGLKDEKIATFEDIASLYNIKKQSICEQHPKALKKLKTLHYSELSSFYYND